MTDINDFKLGDDDAAIVFKDDMSVEMFLPNWADDINIDIEKHQNFYVTVAIMASLDDPAFRAVISKKIEAIMEAAHAESEVDLELPGCTCGPEDCSCEDC